MEMFPHSGCMVEIHDHWMNGSSHVALAASTVEQIEHRHVKDWIQKCCKSHLVRC